MGIEFPIIPYFPNALNSSGVGPREAPGAATFDT